MIIDKKINITELIQLRREFHQIPELGYQEFLTSKKIISFLNKYQISYKKIGKTGVIATIKGDRKGPAIALRSDIDALPIKELSSKKYRSKHNGVMHACGHDGHIAMALMTTKILNDNKDKIGTIRIIFQPAEEGLGGALPMIAGGALKNPNIKYCFAIHLWSRSEIGTLNIKTGPFMATTVEFSIEIIGKGGHGATPHETIDPIPAAAQFVTATQTIVSREIDPFTPSIITIGTINGGSKANIIGEVVSLTGTIRSFSDKNTIFIKKRLTTILKQITAAYRAKYKINFSDGYPAVINHPDATKFVKTAAATLIANNKIQSEPIMAGEDFSYYGKEIPSCLFFVGAGNKKKGISYPHHHPKFDIDEDSLSIGVNIYLKIISLIYGTNV